MAFDVGDDVTRPDRTTRSRATSTRTCATMGLTGDRTRSATRTLRLRARATAQWTINGKTWDDVVDSDYKYVAANPGLERRRDLGARRTTRGGWFHPVHIHLVDFKILNRNGKPPGARTSWAQGRRLRRRGRDGPRDHALRAPARQVHDALPQPGPRGPRHDGPVRGRHGGPDPIMADAARDLSQMGDIVPRVALSTGRQ